MCGGVNKMRWAIRCNAVGFAVGADSVCLCSLDDWRLDNQSFTCVSNEIVRPNKIANGHVAGEAGDGFFRQIFQNLTAKPSAVNDRTGKTTGRQHLPAAPAACATAACRLPSHHFIPDRFSSIGLRGDRPAYAAQRSGSTRSRCDTLQQAT